MFQEFEAALTKAARAAHMEYFDDSAPAEVELVCMRQALLAALKSLSDSGVVRPAFAERK